jgi:hypothetical protein
MSWFPSGLEPVRDLSPASWVREALSDWPKGRRFIVSDLVPPVFEGYARILHRPRRLSDGRIHTGSWGERAAEAGRELWPNTSWGELKGPNAHGDQSDDWKAEEGSLTKQEAEILGSALSSHTSTPFDCWFAMWSGWGDLSGASSGALYRTRGGAFAELTMVWRGWVENWRARWEAARLRTFPLLGQSGRSYLLFHGAVSDAARFQLANRFQSPAVWWPDDRAWLVHTEIDASSTYLGGSRALIEQLVGHQVLESFRVEVDDLAVL